MKTINRINEALAVWLTKGFGSMWVFYAFLVYGLLPVYRLFNPYEAAFLYWSNWVQLWSLPLIMVGTNILGREAERRAKEDHDKLAKSYAEQQKTYKEIIAMLKKQEEVMQGMMQQDRVLQKQDKVLAEQTRMLKAEMPVAKKSTKKAKVN
jgi:hypothetical protein